MAKFRVPEKKKKKKKDEKKRVFTLEEKKGFIKRMEKGETAMEISKAEGVPRSTISTFWQYREKILEAAKTASKGVTIVASKKKRPPQLDEMEKLLHTCLQQWLRHGFPVNGAYLKLKAKKIFDELMERDFPSDAPEPFDFGSDEEGQGEDRQHQEQEHQQLPTFEGE
jgi:hypothetical protein